MPIDLTAARADIDRTWDDDIVPTLQDYIRIPCKSPVFAPDWEADGEIDRAAGLILDWVKGRRVAGLQAEIVKLPGLTPCVLVDIPAFGDAGAAAGDVLLYGHMDKQPELYGWRDGLGPWEPVIEDGRLYGRGGADDGYSAFGALAAIEAVQAHGGSHGHCVVLIEGSEESGSIHLPAYIDHLAGAGRLGSPSLVVCLDSGCATYDKLWVTSSLRGMVLAVLRIDVLTEGVHSGGAGGVVPDTLRVLRILLDRIEDPATGDARLPELMGDIPAERKEQMAATGAELGPGIHDVYPWFDGVGPDPKASPAELLERKTWLPSLSVTGLDGVPATVDAGNVLRPSIGAKLSLRLPPTVDPETARDAVVAALTADPPYGVKVDVEIESIAAGWNAPPLEPWLSAALEEASQATFGGPVRFIGEGGTIPFMAMLGERFPGAQFVVTGVLGPGANAHGPNEFLDIATGKSVTASVAHVLDAHARRS